MLAIGAGIVGLMISQVPVDFEKTLQDIHGCLTSLRYDKGKVICEASGMTPLRVFNSFLLAYTTAWIVKLFFDDYYYFSTARYLHGFKAALAVFFTAVLFFVLFRAYVGFTENTLAQVKSLICFYLILICWTFVVSLTTRNVEDDGEADKRKEDMRNPDNKNKNSLFQRFVKDKIKNILRANNIPYFFRSKKDTHRDSLDKYYKSTRFLIYLSFSVILLCFMFSILRIENAPVLYTVTAIIMIVELLVTAVLSRTFNFSAKSSAVPAGAGGASSSASISPSCASPVLDPQKGWRSSDSAIQTRYFSELPGQLVKEKGFDEAKHLRHSWHPDCETVFTQIVEKNGGDTEAAPKSNEPR